MKPGIVIQARCGSTRLPAKVLRPIAGRPMLWHVIERARQARRAARVVVATTTLAEDDRIADFVEALGDVDLIRGSAQDVLSRYALAARTFALDPVVRITSDCPLIDPALIDLAIEAHVAGGADYSTLGSDSGLPLGLSVEVISSAALETAHLEAQGESAREHVTLWVAERPLRFNKIVVEAPPRYRRPSYRLTVDQAEDLALIEALYARLDCAPGTARLDDVIAVLDRDPQLRGLNAEVMQKRPTTLDQKDDDASKPA